MTDSAHGDALGRWFTDALVLNAVFVVVAAIALTSRLWHASLPPTPQQSLATPPSSPSDQKDRKGTRAKERRRRNKDPFRDLLKGGKKSKALLKAIKVPDHDSPPPSADTLSNASVPANDSASSTSRSSSPEPHRDMGLGAESDDGQDTIPNRDTTSTSAVSTGDISDDNAPVACAHADLDHPPDSITVADMQANVRSAIDHAPSSPHDMPQSCVSQTVSTSCANLVRARTRLRAAKLDASARSSPTPIADSVAISFPSLHTPVPCPSMVASTSHAMDAGPSTPTNSEHPDYGEPHISATQTQLASMRGALEAAQLREEQLRVEAEQASKERDELCWRWNEDAGAWRRRETELQAQIHHLMQQLQAYAAVASFQAQQVASNMSSPTSPHAQSPRLQHHGLFPLPPVMQAQNSASAPAHVQALLTSHPPGFAAPTPGLYTGGMSPLLWSGMGLCVPNRDPRQHTPDSSASGSSSRGRRRRRAEDVKSASDESSLGDWDGSGEEDAREAEEEEDIFSNNALADAILKRPESIRVLSGSVRRRMGMGREEKMDALKDPGWTTPLVDTPVTQ